MALATLAVAALLGLACIPWLLSNPARVSRFIAAAIPELRANVKLGAVKLGWSGPIVLENVTIEPHDGGKAPIAIKRIEGSHGLAGILLSGGDVGRIRIEGMETDVVFDAERRSNLQTLFAAPAADPAASGSGRPKRSPVRMQIDVVDALVRIDGPWTDEPWTSDPINVRATLAPSADGPWSEWTLEPTQLLADARLEPGVAQGVLAYIAPVLADSTRTSGRFSLRLDGGRIPVGQPAAGTLSGVLSMHEVVLGPGPMVTNLFQSLPMRLPPPPTIRIADESNVAFRLADRRVWHTGLEFGVPLAKPGQRLDVNSSGSVGVEDKSLDIRLALPIPVDLPQDRPLLAALSGKTISVGIGGVLGQPQVNFDGSIRAAAGNVVADLIDRVRDPDRPRPAGAPAPATAGGPPAPGWKPGQAATEQTPAVGEQAVGKPEGSGDQTAEAIVDLVGGVLEEVARRRSERRAAEAANPDQAPAPRRGRLLRRLVPPSGPQSLPPATAAPSPAADE